MANISDSAGIFTGATLAAFNLMETVVARDGDVSGAAEQMRKACLAVVDTQQTSTSNGSGGSGTFTRRAVRSA